MQAETVVLMITIVVSVLGSSLGTIRIPAAPNESDGIQAH